jgi:fibronectin-binding autotransporter adhesin
MKPKLTSLHTLIIAGLAATGMTATAATWTGSLGAGSYVWNTSGASWDSNPAYPTGAGAAAVFNSNFSGTITMTGDNTLGSINYTDTGSSNNSLQLASGTLTFDTTAGTPTISYLNGTGNGLLWIGQAASFAIAGSDGLTIDAGNTAQGVRLGNASGGVGINWSGFTGALTLSRGAFQPQVVNVLPQAAGSWIVLGTNTTSAQLNLFQDSRNQAVTGLNGTSNGRVVQGSYAQNKAGTFTLLTNSIATDSFDFAGVLGSISATPATVKQESYFGITLNGAGTQTLSGANTYVGQTTVTAGTLKLGSNTALGGGVTATLTTTAASATASVDDSTGLAVGQLVTGAGVANGTYITAISGTTVTLSSNAAASGANSTAFAGATTVASAGVVDLNGRTITESFGTNSSDGLTGAGPGAGGTLKNTSGTAAVINGNILSNSNFTIGSGNIAVNGIVGRRSSGGSTITKTGSGILTLGGSGNNAAFGAAGLIIDDANSTVVLAKNGANILAVSDVTINSGTLKMDPNNQVSAASAWSGQIANTVTMNGGTWDLNDSGTNGVNNRVKGVIGTAGNITNTGTGVAQLTFGLRDNGTKEFSGTISDGTNGGTLRLEVSDTFAGTPYQKLSGNNSYSGGTTINSGRMIMGHNNAFGIGAVASRGQVDLNGFNLSNALTSPGNGAIFTNTSATAATVSNGFNAAGAGGIVISDFTVNGTGDIAWSGAIRRTNFAGTVTKSGDNTLTLSGVGTGYAGMSYTVTGGTLAFNMPHGSNFNSGAISSSASVVAAQGSGVTNTISVAINGTGTFTQSGSGTTILTAGNGYTGNTLVSNGILVVNGSLANTTTTIASGAILAGDGSIGGATTISGSLRPGNSIGTMTVGNDVIWNSGEAWVFELGSAAATLGLAGAGSSIQDMLDITGTHDFLKGTGAAGSFVFNFAGTGSTGYYKLVDWDGTTDFTNAAFSSSNLSSGLTGTFSVDSASSALYLNVVPEPRAALLGGLGLLALLRRRR